jgi:hypothetical protein
MRYGGKILYSRAGNRLQYGARALHAGYLSLKPHTENKKHLLLLSTATMFAQTCPCVDVHEVYGKDATL